MIRHSNSWKIFTLFLATAPMNHAMDTSFETISRQSDGPLMSEMESMDGVSSISPNQSDRELAEFEFIPYQSSVDSLSDQDGEDLFYDALDSVAQSTSNKANQEQMVDTSLQFVPESSDSRDLYERIIKVKRSKQNLYDNSMILRNLNNQFYKKLEKEIKANQELKKEGVARFRDIANSARILDSSIDSLLEARDQYLKNLKEATIIIPNEEEKLSEMYAKTSYKDHLPSILLGMTGMKSTKEGVDYYKRKPKLESYKKLLNSIQKKSNTEYGALIEQAREVVAQAQDMTS